MDIAEEQTALNKLQRVKFTECGEIANENASSSNAFFGLAACQTSNQLNPKIFAPPRLRASEKLASMTISEMKQAVNSVGRLINQFEDGEVTTPSSLAIEDEDLEDNEGDEYLLMSPSSIEPQK